MRIKPRRCKRESPCATVRDLEKGTWYEVERKPAGVYGTSLDKMFQIAVRQCSKFTVNAQSGARKGFPEPESQPASERQRSHCVSGLGLAGCRGNAKMGNRREAMKVLIPVAIGAIAISIAFSRRSVKAGVERTLSLRPGRSIAAQPAGIHNGQFRVNLPPISNGQGPFFRQFPGRQVERLVRPTALGKTVRLRFSRRNPLFRFSMALVVYMTLRAVCEYLNIGLMQSQLSVQRFMLPGYLASQVARTSSKRLRAVCSSGAW